jgi:hypothetical protein
MPSRRVFVLFLLLAGCSTHPCADFSDFFKPGHLYPDKVTPYGGVCIPQGVNIQGTSPSGPFGPVVPPPVPLPPNVPPPPPTGPISVPTFPAPSPPPLR